MKRFFLVALVILMVGALILGGCAKPTPTTPTPTPATPTSGEAIELTYSYWTPPTLPSRLFHEPWASQLERLTNGRVTVKFYPGAVLGPPPEQLDIVLSRRTDIGWIAPSHFPGVFPYSDAMYLPFLYKTAKDGAQIWWGLIEKYEDDLFPGVKLLFMNPTSVFDLHTRTKQVKTLEDLKGMKLVMDSAVQVEMTKLLGAVPVYVHEGEIYTTLERGLVEGRWREHMGRYFWKEYEVTYYTTDNIKIMSNHTGAIMNLDSWNALPPDVQEIIDSLRQSNGLWSGATFDMYEERVAVAWLKEHDKKVGNPDWYPLPAEERARWVKAIEPIYDWWVSDMEANGYTKAREVLEYARYLGKVYTGEIQYKY